jgi:hypothetical protein
MLIIKDMRGRMSGVPVPFSGKTPDASFRGAGGSICNYDVTSAAPRPYARSRQTDRLSVGRFHNEFKNLSALPPTPPDRCLFFPTSWSSYLHFFTVFTVFRQDAPS